MSIDTSSIQLSLDSNTDTNLTSLIKINIDIDKDFNSENQNYISLNDSNYLFKLSEDSIIGKIDKIYQVFNLTDSLKYIEEILGLKLETTNEYGGGVRIVNVSLNSTFYKKSEKLKKFVIQYIHTCDKIKIKNTSELCKTIYSFAKDGYPIITFSGIQKLKDTMLTNIGVFSKKVKTFDFSELFQTPILKNDTINKLNDNEITTYSKCMFYHAYNPMINTFTSTFGGILFGWNGAILISALPLIDPPSAPKYVNNQSKNLEKIGLNGTLYYKTYAKENKKLQTISRVLGLFGGAAFWCLFITLTC
jgi:hypothetical protein